MSTCRSKALRALLLLAVALAAVAGIALVFDVRKAPPSPRELVPVVWQDARETPMHVLHVGQKKIACTECHEGGVDAGAPGEASCAKCHAAQTKRAHHGAAESPTTCVTCHVFGAGKPLLRCNDCHATDRRADAGAPLLAHHAGETLPCAACHAVHRDPAPADCTSCHADAGARHGTLAAPALCDGCHAPHAGKEVARETCAACHVASRAPAGVTAARGWTSFAGTLAERSPRIVPRGPRVAGHDACVTCHEPHRARKADVRGCASCHADRASAAAVKGHASCTGCHAPHAPAEARGTCTTGCHAAVATIAAARVPAHAACTSCHDPHRPEVSAGKACVRCHESTKPGHPPAPPTAASPDRGPCVGCHAPHVAAPAGHAGVATPCASCHANVRGGPAVHAKTLACVGCHAPHAFRLAEAGRELCAKCHRAEATAARAGHSACKDCHGGAHATTAKPACASCHAAEAATAPRGHAACTTCHDAHSGARTKRAPGAGSPSISSCTSCHAEKEKAPHAGAGCASCHRAHGPNGVERPPACTKCHDKPLPGLHARPGHATCASCHLAHAPPRTDRATCTTGCHADKRDHQPEAKVCKGCHFFRQVNGR